MISLSQHGEQPGAESPLAVVSDVHGNRWALEALVDDVRARGIEAIVNLGDCLYGPLDPVGTAEILIDLDIPTVRGNEDRLIIDRSIASGSSTTLAFVRDRLKTRQLRWLESLAPTMVLDPDFFLCHGTLDRDEQYLLWDVADGEARFRTSDELEVLLSSVSQSVVLCGHDHTPGRVFLPGGQLVVNPGSVGLQAYTDDIPEDHAIENGSPHARYAILTQADSNWQVEFVTLAYDWDRAAETASSNGRDDWAEWLRTGCVAI